MSNPLSQEHGKMKGAEGADEKFEYIFLILINKEPNL